MSPLDLAGRRSQRGGMTLVEIVMALVLIGIIVTIMVPPITRASRRYALDAAAQAFMGDLRRARIEAIKRNKGVTLKRTGSDAYAITYIGNRTLPGEAFFVADSSADSVRFAAFGPTSTPGPAKFKIRLGQGSKTVEVNTAGMTKVQ